MASVMPEGDALRQAVKWISQQLLDQPEQKLWPLINNAISRFDLNPRDAEYLIHFYQKDQNEKAPA